MPCSPIAALAVSILTDAQLSFDAGNAIVDIDNFTGESVKLDVQVIEARFQNTEARIDCSFEPSEPRIHGIVINDVRQQCDQYREGGDSNR